MPQRAQKLTFSLESLNWKPVLSFKTSHKLACGGIEERFVHNFGGTDEIIAFCLTDFSIGSNAEGLVFVQVHGLESDGFLWYTPL